MATDAPPAGYHTLTPRMVVADVVGAVEFLRATFGAVGDIPDIGDSLVMVTALGEREPFPAFLYAIRRQARDGARSVWQRSPDRAPTT